MSLDAFLAEGARNRVKAHGKYEREKVAVTGKVERVGLQGFTKLVGNVGPLGQVSINRRREMYAWASLLPKEANHGRLHCFFDPGDREQVEDLEPGQSVTVEGVFMRFRNDGAGLVAQLAHCDVIEP